MKTKKDYEILVEEHRLLEKEFRVLREECTLWKDECNTSKEQYNELRVECNELRSERRNDIQVIAQLRRNNHTLWEQLETGSRTSSPLRTPSSLRTRNLNESLQGSQFAQSTNTNRTENENGSENENDNGNENEIAEETTTDSLPHDANGTQEDPQFQSPTPNGKQSASFRNSPYTDGTPHTPVFTRRTSSSMHVPPYVEDDYTQEADAQDIMFEAQSQGYQRTMTVVLAQLERKTSDMGIAPLQALTRTAQSTQQQQWFNHQAHLAHMRALLHLERDVSLRLREDFEEDSLRIEEASLNTLREQIRGMKNVFQAIPQ